MVSSMLSLFMAPVFLATAILATPFQPTFSSCLSSYPAIPGASQINVTNVYANLVSADEASKLGLSGDGHNVLRMNLIGVTGQEIVGYDNSTNKLGKRDPPLRDLLTRCSDALHDHDHCQHKCLFFHRMAVQLFVSAHIANAILPGQYHVLPPSRW